MLTAEQRTRYARQIALPEIGEEGQERLLGARALIVGAGGLGCPAALYLAAAGVGTLGIVDGDVVDATNLQRQVLFTPEDVGKPKAEVAARRLQALNPDVRVEPLRVRLTPANALGLLSHYEVVLDGSDNFPTRYLVNDACCLRGVPDVWGGILRFEGQVSSFNLPGGPCYRCLFREPPDPGAAPSCEEAGVLGVLPGIIGSLQAAEAIKLLLGRGEALRGRLLLVDALAMAWREVPLRKDPACPACSGRPGFALLADYEAFCGGPPCAAACEISPRDLARGLAGAAPPVLIDVRSEEEFRAGAIAGSVRIPPDRLLDRVRRMDPGPGGIVLVCRRGVRSRRAAAELRAAGVADVRSLSGGLQAWEEL